MKKNLLSTLLFCLVAGLGFSQTVFYTEDFESGIPDGWTADGEWVLTDAAGAASDYWVPEEHTMFMDYNDDALGQGVVGGGRITTAAFDLSVIDASTAFLEFQYFFIDGDYDADETATVLVSTDEGATWEEVLDVVGVTEWSGGFADLSAYVGQTIWLAFEYDDGGGWNYGFSLDDIQILDIPATVPERSYAMSTRGAEYVTQALNGIVYDIEGIVRNGGYERITSFDIVLDGPDGTTTYNYTTDLGFGDAMGFKLDDPVTVGADLVGYTASIANVNGIVDEDENTDDNSRSFSFQGIELEANKATVIEEATGTWCQWCPRGTVYLDEMSKRFGEHFVGIAVHNQDPMVVAAYDNGLTAFPNFPGFPSVIHNRESVIDPGDIVNPSITDMGDAPIAGITVGATLDGTTLNTSVEVNFMEDVTGADHNVLLVITEDGLTGEDSDWNQINNYAGGANGEMGGFEFLGRSVPSHVWPYDHVARALIGGYAGANVVTGDFAAGESKGHYFDSYTVFPTINTDNIHLVGILLDAGGAIVNASSVKLDEAIANGLSTGTEDNFDNIFVDVFPNPARDIAKLNISLDEAANVSTTLINAVGQTVAIFDYGKQSGSVVLDYNVADVLPGMYFINIQIDDKIITKRLTIVE